MVSCGGTDKLDFMFASICYAGFIFIVAQDKWKKER